MKIIPWSWHEASENRDAFALLRPYQKKEKKSDVVRMYTNITYSR